MTESQILIGIGVVLFTLLMLGGFALIMILPLVVLILYVGKGL
jgi:hypothetical protein